MVLTSSGKVARVEDALKSIQAAGGKAISVAADISKADGVKQIFEAARSKFGEITAVVNGAGIMPLAPIQKGDLDAFDR